MTQCEERAKRFLKKYDVRMKIILVGEVDGFPNDPHDKLKHHDYIVILTRSDKSYDFHFYGSNNDYRMDKRPTAYDILACLEKYEISTDPWEFAREFGYDIECKADYERVQKIAEECNEQYQKLCWLFDGKIPEELLCIE